MNKMKKKLFLMAIFALVVTLFVIADTYGLFETEALAMSDFDIGEWHIYVNNVDATVNETITLNNFTCSASSASQHVDSGYFAPGVNCWFDLVINMSSASVSVQYDLDIDDSEVDDYPNIYFSILNVDTNQTMTTNTYSGVSLLSDSSRVKTLRIYLNWDNNSLYDESDSTLINGELNFTVTADFIQYTGV